MSEARKIGKEWELAGLLVEALATPERLSRFLNSLRIPAISKEPARSVELIALEAIDELRRRGLIDVLFDRLIKEHPDYGPRIHELQLEWVVDVDQWAGTGRELLRLEGHFDRVTALAVTCAWRIQNHAAIGVWYKPRQWLCHRYESKPIGNPDPSPMGSGRRPPSPA